MKKKATITGAYAKALRTDAVVNAADKRTKSGRFLKNFETKLAAQLGHPASFAEEVLIHRAARAALSLELLDAKFVSGDWTAHDSRTQGGLSNNLRLVLRELGIKAGKPPPPTIEEIAARINAKGAPK